MLAVSLLVIFQITTEGSRHLRGTNINASEAFTIKINNSLLEEFKTACCEIKSHRFYLDGLFEACAYGF